MNDCVVLERLYLGCLSDVNKIASMPRGQQSDRWTVVSILSRKGLIGLAKEEVLKLPTHRVTHVIWELKDRVNAPFLCEELLRVLQTIEESLDDGNYVLVHCYQGKSRSAAVVAAYMIHKRVHSTLRDTMDSIRQVRPVADPNMGFIAALKAIERADGDVPLAVHRWNDR
uniref:protein-tyrosine-phosphatase n=1 Tax=Grammatophora oceanica TaxID=210454 RepID=A0A7S1VI70_9STRA|mmetsp:Transcript_4721/g.6559  ORF Transcript_4721/g.6559 Transcript_4721/m.6559 type:complete len:170 (+) Transcript_4721:18-527(+)